MFESKVVFTTGHTVAETKSIIAGTWTEIDRLSQMIFDLDRSLFVALDAGGIRSEAWTIYRMTQDPSVPLSLVLTQKLERLSSLLAIFRHAMSTMEAKHAAGVDAVPNGKAAEKDQAEKEAKELAEKEAKEKEAKEKEIKEKEAKEKEAKEEVEKNKAKAKRKTPINVSHVLVELSLNGELVLTFQHDVQYVKRYDMTLVGTPTASGTVHFEMTHVSLADVKSTIEAHIDALTTTKIEFRIYGIMPNGDKATAAVTQHFFKGFSLVGAIDNSYDSSFKNVQKMIQLALSFCARPCGAAWSRRESSI